MYNYIYIYIYIYTYIYTYIYIYLFFFLFFLFFDSQIRPSMDYGCEICGTNNTNGMRDMEPIHLKFLKAMLGVRKQTTSAAVYADTGRVPLGIQWDVQTLK